MAAPVIDNTPPELTIVTWTGVVTGTADDAFEIPPGAGAVASFQVSGDFGGGTCAIKVSNDGVTFTALTDQNGNAVEFSANGLLDISTAARYILPDQSGGTADDLDVTAVFFG